MADATSGQLSPETPVHRVGGGRVENLRLKPREQSLTPPGISVLLGGTAGEAAAQMRQAFPDPKKFSHIHELAQIVGSTTAEEVGKAGFVILPDPSDKFPNHARLTHADGGAGFNDANLLELAKVFQDTLI